MITVTIANGLKKRPKDYDFSILPNIIFNRPVYCKSFTLSIEWGHWAIIFWFIK